MEYIETALSILVLVAFTLGISFSITYILAVITGHISLRDEISDMMKGSKEKRR